MAFLENQMLLFFSVKLVLCFTLIISPLKLSHKKAKKCQIIHVKTKRNPVEITHNSFEQALVDLRPTS